MNSYFMCDLIRNFETYTGYIFCQFVWIFLYDAVHIKLIGLINFDCQSQ